MHEQINSEVPKNTKQTTMRLLRELMKQRKKFIIIILAAIFYSILLTTFPLIIGWGLDNLISLITEGSFTVEKIIEALMAPVIVGIVVSIVYSLCSLVQEFTMASVSETMTLGLRKKIAYKLKRVPMSYFDNNKVGDILVRSTSDLDKVSEVLQVGLMQLITSALSIILSIGLMFYLSPKLSVGILIIIGICGWLTNKLANKNQQLFSDNQQTLGALGTKVEELYTGNQLIKAFNKQEDSIQEMTELNEAQYQAFKKAQFVSFAINPLMRFISQLGFIVSAVVGGFSVINGVLTIGAVQAYLQYINQVSEPITQASYVINSLQSAIAAMERVFEITDAPEEASETSLPDFEESIDGEIDFEHVQFGYSPEKMIMQDVSFHVKANETVAIVGPTGAGKTTLVNLLMRFYELNDGDIKIDGRNIAKFKKDSIREQFGMVLQDTWLFEGTIAENIAYGKQDATREEIMQAAKAARCHHFIQTLPNGYDTMISSDNSTISQGQQQLLTIARAMLANPRIMILDEATSSVDTKTELEIQAAMNELTKERTSFVIAHRLSTIKNADLILVMKNGNIIEKGTHNELLRRKSFYANLYNSQFAK